MPLQARFTKNQTFALEQSFAINPYPSKCTIKQLTKQTLLSEKQIRNWHRDKRMKTRNKKEELTPSTGELLNETFIVL